MKRLSLFSFPRAILHVDGDCFFASCEVARNPSLRGKPVITGRERGIASSLTYEAKARGVTRGMQLSEIRRVCPEAIILPSDYESYSLYSKRMFEIVRRYTPDVEEYSIDECFADLTGLRRPLGMSYEHMAERIKFELDSELGMTFSVGLSVNKVTAKLASKWKKPSGLTIIPAYNLHLYLNKLPVEKIWGIGPNTTAHLNKYGIKTALQFAEKEKEWVKEKLTKPHQEIWEELRGGFVYELTTKEKHDYKSIGKTRTFTPPSNDREFVFSQLSKNIENACIKLRRHGLYTKEVAFFLKKQDFSYAGLELKLSASVCIPQAILEVVRKNFDEIYIQNVLYRATGIVLLKLSVSDTGTMDLFGGDVEVEKMNRIYESVDEVAKKYGKHTVFLGSSFLAMKNHQHEGDRGVTAERKRPLLKGETDRRHLAVPLLGKVK
jgi:nucleotidyltransferase/DNA polymerase involved in DNA repair